MSKSVGRPAENEAVRRQAACEAAHLLGEAIRQLLIPQHLHALADKWESEKVVTDRYAGAIRHTALIASIIAIYRVRETVEHLVVPWVLSASELQDLAFPRIEAFVGTWGHFMTVRGQWAGHALAAKASGNVPGRMIAPAVLGRALRTTGLADSESFLRRVREDLVPAVERLRDAILERYPEGHEFITTTYPVALERALEEPPGGPEG